ncbi:uncharacterized protein GIQ15_03256 [Arthroderma uncinatum]|uniref:uncharacterized protein n=1 Tax=Arthroderma uncinatum TaxID=74035 RepID=UPI00144AC999|nr:uncharacterized protein GIQ15_03256 [Arthroderma uncinatum]KAF3483932.1 hypothetical protein GIQ15_03256 [Arthroderma uncinatum]
MEPAPEYQHPELMATPCGNLAITNGTGKYSAIYPPKALYLRILGELNKKLKPIYPQGNGRSFIIKGNVYYLFGTTVWRDSKGEIAGEAANSVTLATDPKVNPIANIAFPANKRMKPLVPLTESEEKLEKEHTSKVILEMPGGLWKPQSGAVGGYIWFQKYVQTCSPQGNFKRTLHGVGIATVVWNRQTGEMTAERIMNDTMLFEANEPAFGAFCSILDEHYFYTWGKLGEDTYLARVEKWEPDNRDAYEYWNGHEFTKDMTTLAPVFSGYTSGTVMRTKMFGHLYNWVFIGGTETNRPVVTIGVARNIHGPYMMSELIQPEQIHPAFRHVHSVYAHQWAYQEKYGQLLISWNETDNENVMGVKVQLAMRHQCAFWKDISFKYMPSVVSALIIGRADFIKTFAQAKTANCDVEHDEDGKTIIKVFASEEGAADAAVDAICNLICGWCDELLEEGRVARMEERGLSLKKILRLRF